MARRGKGLPPVTGPVPAAPCPGKARGPPGGHTGCTPGSAVHLIPEHASSAARPWPSVEKPTVHTDRPGGTDAVRYTSVDTAAHRPAVIHADTRRDEKKNGPPDALPQPGGRFPRWRQVLGSNQRRLSRRFYRPLSFCTSRTPLTGGYAPQPRSRACAPQAPHSPSGPRTSPRIATDAATGAVTPTVPPTPRPAATPQAARQRGHAARCRDPGRSPPAPRRKTQRSRQPLSQSLQARSAEARV
jgi:hypothetical protein